MILLNIRKPTTRYVQCERRSNPPTRPYQYLYRESDGLGERETNE